MSLYPACGISRFPPDLGPTLYGELWQVARHLQAENSILCSIQRLAIEKLPLAARRTWYSQCKAAGLPAPSLQNIALRWDPAIRRHAIGDESIYYLSEFSLRGDLPLGPEVRSCVTGLALNTDYAQQMLLLAWSAEERARIRLVSVSKLDSYTLALLTLLPEADTIYRKDMMFFGHDCAQTKSFLGATIALPEKFHRIILKENDLSFKGAMELVQRLLNEGFELVLQDCAVRTKEDLSYLDQHFPAKLSHSYNEDKRVYLATGCLTTSAKRQGSQVPGTPWKELLPPPDDYAPYIANQARNFSNPALPAEFRKCFGVENSLVVYAKDTEKLRTWIAELTKHWSSLSEVPQSAKICDFVRTTLGAAALDLLETPANWKLLADDHLPLDKALDRDILEEKIFKFSAEKTISKRFEKEGAMWSELVEAGRRYGSGSSRS